MNACYGIELEMSYRATHSSLKIGQIAPLRDPLRAPKGTPCSTPPEANFSTKNHHKTMIFEDSEAEILRTPIKIEKLSWWNRSGVEFIMNFEFHGFLEKNSFFFWGKIVIFNNSPRSIFKEIYF